MLTLIEVTELKNGVMKLAEYCLDCVEIVLPNENYKIVRGKILGRANDVCRKLDDQYSGNGKENKND
jgi:hypothetical protein